MKKIAIIDWDELKDRTPTHALVADVDLVIVRFDDEVSVMYGRCAHRGALMSDGFVKGDNLICGVHFWDYRLDTGVSEYNHSETLPKLRGLRHILSLTLEIPIRVSFRITPVPATNLTSNLFAGWQRKA
jgi:nitrite reductase/ring-hydroxylating ferredoxin subunit